MRLKMLLFLILVPVLVAGCGGGSNQSGTAISKLAASQGCVSQDCHATWTSPGSGAVIAEEWRASAHNLKNGAGCADCHEPHAGHPQSCSKCHGGGSGVAIRNPDGAGKCGKCHGLSYPGDVMVAQAPQHFGNISASELNTKYRASYVSSRNVNNCRNCHNPHNPSGAITIARQWAQSAHGNTKAKAYAYYDFKTMGSAQPSSTTFESNCVRCHTTTGYINFVNSGFVDIHAWGSGSDKTKEVTACNACHDDGAGRTYGYGLRNVAVVSIYYNYSSSKSSPTVKLNNNKTLYPDAGASNLCMPCHTGRAVGQMIKDAAALGLNFANVNMPNGHYRSAGATVFQLGGYEFVGRSYSNASFLHSSIGLGNNRGTGGKGPCITCHMTNGTSHLFMPVTLDDVKAVTGVVSATCVKCHDSSFQTSHTAVSLQVRKAGYGAALAMLNIIKTGKSTSTDWDTFDPGNGANTMGASFNYNLLSSEPGAYAHNPLYTKRLIYDSIDWISNAGMDDDVAAAISAATLPGSITNPITKIAYTPAEVAGLKSLAIAYLSGSGGGRP
uniref:Uncharacterized protein n=1 Tax=Geobacter sp. (strain M21) TaxID=443144 RepID=C6E1N9_GEOSM